MSTNSKGIFYIVHDDAPITEEARSLALANSVPVGPNYLLNGGMDINQRGLTSTPAYRWDSYLADRWRGVNSEVQASIQDVSDSSVPCTKALRLGVNNGENSNLRVGQKIESVHAKDLRNKTVTVSFYVRFSAATWTPTYGSPTQFQYGIGVNTTTTDSAFSNVTFDSSATTFIANGSFPTTWTRVSFTTTISATANNVTFYTNFNAAFAATNSSLWYEITGVQLEVGSSATTFRRNAPSLQAELAACQRYYWRNGNDSPANAYGQLAHGFQFSTTSVGYVINVPVPMRVYPTSIGWSGIEASDEVYYGAAFSSLFLSIYRTDTRSIYIQGTIASNGAQFRPATLRRTASNNGYLEFNAEL